MKLINRLKGISLEKAALGQTATLLRRYVIQETMGPLRHIGRTLGFGLAGGLLVGLGASLSLLGVLRLFETETGHVFAGDWSFVPYLLTALVGSGMVALAVLGLIRRGLSKPGSS